MINISGPARSPEIRSGSTANYLLLILVTVIWGGTFIVTRRALALTQPFTFLAIRFSFASILLAVVFNRRLRAVTPAEIRQGVFIGIILFASLAMQALGSRLTTASEAAFLVGLSVPVVPLIGLPLLRKRPSFQALTGIVISFAGLTLISTNGKMELHLGSGEWMMLGAALTSALHIVVISKFAPNSDAMNLASIQIITCATMSVAMVFVWHEARCVPPVTVVATAVIMGLFATAFALVVMSRVQQTVCATKATLIYALEPVWAGGFGLLAGEALRPSAWSGCGLIFTGVIVGSVRFSKSATKQKECAR